MMKSNYIYQIDKYLWVCAKANMIAELRVLRGINHPIELLLRKAIADFEAGKFSYDGATFVKERYRSIFEVAAFIHDWRNSMGYVSYFIDKEMFDIMITLNYDLNLIKWRWFLTRFTFLNIIRHRVMCTYVAASPPDLYILNN